MVPSTGRLPPTPNPTAARIIEAAVKFGAFAKPKANIPVIARVELNPSLLPTMSDPIPHPAAPSDNPT